MSAISNNKVQKNRKVRNSRVYFHDRNVKLKKNDKSIQKCFSCEDFHVIINCPVFRILDHSQRWHLVRDKSLCGKCLRIHSYPKCISKVECKKMGEKNIIYCITIKKNQSTIPRSTMFFYLLNAKRLYT